MFDKTYQYYIISHFLAALHSTAFSPHVFLLLPFTPTEARTHERFFCRGQQRKRDRVGDVTKVSNNKENCFMNKLTVLCVYCALSLTNAVDAREPYLLLNYQSGGVAVSVDYGCGQHAHLHEGGHPLYLQTNKVEAGVHLTLELDRRNSDRAAAAIAHLRAIAPPIVPGSSCPQPQPVMCTTGYCGRTICSPAVPAYGPAYAPPPIACAPGYCGRPVCAPAVMPMPTPIIRPGYCGRVPCTCGYCARHAPPALPVARPGYCGRVPCVCGHCAGHAAVPMHAGGSCCSGRGDGRNPMVLYPPGDPRGVCHCAANRNGPGRSCACPPDCPQCNPGLVAGYAR